MNSVGIDISKGRSTVAVMRPFGEVVISPFEVRHTYSELSELARRLKSLNGETHVVMEATGNYHTPVAKLLYDAGLYVSVVNAKLVHGYRWVRCQDNFTFFIPHSRFDYALIDYKVVKQRLCPANSQTDPGSCRAFILACRDVSSVNIIVDFRRGYCHTQTHILGICKICAVVAVSKLRFLSILPLKKLCPEVCVDWFHAEMMKAGIISILKYHACTGPPLSELFQHRHIRNNGIFFW